MRASHLAAVAEFGHVEARSSVPSFGKAGGERWYVATTLPHKENVAVANLRREGFCTFLPLYRKTRRHARKLDTIFAPLFPRYIFVAVDVDRDRWRSINGTLGVQRIVSNGEMPIPVPAGIVETLHQSLDEKGALIFTESLTVGTKIRLLSGPFADALGILRRLDGAGRVQILLNLLGGDVKVSVPRHMVLAVQ
jgi:transcription elongation factor/antiterminator RfaH